MRKMGPAVTRVKSTILDSWLLDMIKIMDNVNNKLSNDYWEYRLPKNYERPTCNSTLEELHKFAKDKYIKKLFIPTGFCDPVTEYKNKMKKEIHNKFFN